MRLRDMLAAAVRPWVSVERRDGDVRLWIGKAHSPRSVYIGGTVRDYKVAAFAGRPGTGWESHRVALFDCAKDREFFWGTTWAWKVGDLCLKCALDGKDHVSFLERKAAEDAAKAANDSKAAA